MKIPFKKTKKGFTIVEVSLVLAIGGLIMLMVFIAWPAVQRNQRDSQRRTVDMPYLISQLANYNSQNHAIPKAADTSKSFAYVNGGETAEELAAANSAEGNISNNGWYDFYKNYILINGATFSDPSSGAYGLNIITCGKEGSGTFAAPNKGLSKDDACSGSSTTKGVRLLDSETGKLSITYADQGAYVTIVVGAYCDNDTVRATTTGTGGSRNYAVLYAMEAGGTFCQSS